MRVIFLGNQKTAPARLEKILIRRNLPIRDRDQALLLLAEYLTETYDADVDNKLSACFKILIENYSPRSDVVQRALWKAVEHYHPDMVKKLLEFDIAKDSLITAVETAATHGFSFLLVLLLPVTPISIEKRVALVDLCISSSPRFPINVTVIVQLLAGQSIDKNRMLQNLRRKIRSLVPEKEEREQFIRIYKWVQENF